MFDKCRVFKNYLCFQNMFVFCFIFFIFFIFCFIIIYFIIITIDGLKAHAPFQVNFGPGWTQNDPRQGPQQQANSPGRGRPSCPAPRRPRPAGLPSLPAGAPGLVFPSFSRGPRAACWLSLLVPAWRRPPPGACCFPSHAQPLTPAFLLTAPIPSQFSHAPRRLRTVGQAPHGSGPAVRLYTCSFGRRSPCSRPAPCLAPSLQRSCSYFGSAFKLPSARYSPCHELATSSQFLLPHAIPADSPGSTAPIRQSSTIPFGPCTATFRARQVRPRNPHTCCHVQLHSTKGQSNLHEVILNGQPSFPRLAGRPCYNQGLH